MIRPNVPVMGRPRFFDQEIYDASRRIPLTVQLRAYARAGTARVGQVPGPTSMAYMALVGTRPVLVVSQHV